MISKLLLQVARKSMWVCGCQTPTLGLAVLSHTWLECTKQVKKKKSEPQKLTAEVFC